MQYALYVLCRCVSVLIDVVLIAMTVRMVLSIFGYDSEESRLMFFLEVLTEPVIAPVRWILSLFGIGEDLPVDVGFFATALLLSALQIFLPPLVL